MPRLKKVKIEEVVETKEVEVEAPVLPQELPVEPVKPKVDEFLQFSEVELNGKRYKKTFDAKTGTTFLDPIV